MTTEKTLITHAEYMSNSSQLHDAFYRQFVTAETLEFVKRRIGIAKLKKSNDGGLFNDIIKHSDGGRGGWVWDYSPVNLELMRKAGAVSPGYLPSKSSHTCVGKAAARMLLEQLQQAVCNE